MVVVGLGGVGMRGHGAGGRLGLLWGIWFSKCGCFFRIVAVDIDAFAYDPFLFSPHG